MAVGKRGGSASRGERLPLSGENGRHNPANRLGGMSMETTPANSDLIQRKSAASRPIARTNGRSRATNDPLFLARDESGRRQARRRRDLVRMFIEALGPDVSDLTLVAVRKAAELVTAAEAARARVLNGGTSETDRICAADLDMLVKLEGEARRAVRALGLKLDAAKPTKPGALPWSPLRHALAKAAAIGRGEPT
jgi:hypothetical protein